MRLNLAVQCPTIAPSQGKALYRQIQSHSRSFLLFFFILGLPFVLPSVNPFFYCACLYLASQAVRPSLYDAMLRYLLLFSSFPLPLAQFIETTESLSSQYKYHHQEVQQGMLDGMEPSGILLYSVYCQYRVLYRQVSYHPTCLLFFLLSYCSFHTHCTFIYLSRIYLFVCWAQAQAQALYAAAMSRLLFLSCSFRFTGITLFLSF